MCQWYKKGNMQKKCTCVCVCVYALWCVRIKSFSLGKWTTIYWLNNSSGIDSGVCVCMCAIVLYVCLSVFGFLYSTVTGAALSFPPTHVPHNSNVNINTLRNDCFELHFSSWEMKAARSSFIFMFPKWHTSEQEDAHDAAELWGAHLDEPRKGGIFCLNIIASTYVGAYYKESYGEKWAYLTFTLSHSLFYGSDSNLILNNPSLNAIKKH